MLFFGLCEACAFIKSVVCRHFAWRLLHFMRNKLSAMI